MADPNPTPSLLDSRQIFQRAFDESNDRLRTDTVVNANFTGEMMVDVRASDGDSVLVSDGTKNAGVTTVNGQNGLDVNVLNNIGVATAGLKTGLKTTKQIITDVATQIPAVALANRNTISIRILGTSTVYFGEDTVTSAAGYPKFQYEEMVADITDNPSVSIWAVCAAGETCEVRILEIA
jgi:hypothetical protein